MTRILNSMTDAVTVLAAAARLGVDLGGMDPEAAVLLAAKNAHRDAQDARTRGGRWAQESTSDQIDDALFLGSVAFDVLDGTVSRPSIGNTRAAVLAAATQAPA